MSAAPADNEDFFDYAKTAPVGPPPQYFPAPPPQQFYPAAAGYPQPYFPQPGQPMPYPPAQFYQQPYPADPYGTRRPGPLRNLDGSPAVPTGAARRPPPRKVMDEPSETEKFDFLPEPQVTPVEEPETAGPAAGLRRLAGRFSRRQQLDPAQMSAGNQLPSVDTDYEDTHPTIINDGAEPALYDLTQDFYVVKDGQDPVQGPTVLTEPDGDPDARVLPLKEPLLDFGSPGEPAGISTWIVGGALAAASVTALVVGGPGASLFVIAEASLLTAFYVLATSRMSWARISGKRLAGAVAAGSVCVFMLGAAVSPPTADPVTVDEVSSTVQFLSPGH